MEDSKYYRRRDVILSYLSPIINIVYTVYYILILFLLEDFKNYIKRGRQINRCKDNEVFILSNGPSLNKEIDIILNHWDYYSKFDFCVVNFIANEAYYDYIKPQYYVLSDPMFFRNNREKSEQGKKLCSTISEKTHWPLNIYIQYIHQDSDNLRLFSNKNIDIKIFHSMPYRGIGRFRNFIFNKGLGNGQYGTVTQNAIYLMILLGYKKIHLLGVDHNFFEDLVVTKENIVCRKEKHNYDTNNPVLKPVLIAGKPANLTTFITWHNLIFQGHEILNEYAKSCNATIINNTTSSMIDCYKKEELC